MKKKKTLVAIIALLLVVVVGATFAYFQTSASFENVFNTGTYKLVTTEVFESPDNWKPGDEIPKTITTKNEGTIDAAVRVSYTEQWLDENDQDITSQVAVGAAIINLDNTNKWTKEGNYYYYNYILKPNDTTSSFMKSVTLNPNIGSDVTCTTSQDGLTKTCESSNPALGAKYILTLTKETVQADKYQEVWDTNIEITEKTNTITYINRQVEGQITPGDVIGIGETEDFYVLSSNSEKTVLIAKYNLLVGVYNNESTNFQSVPIPQITPGYGLQSINAVGGYSSDIGYGTVAFSAENYWMNGDALLSSYNKNDTIYSDTSSYTFRYREDETQAYPYVYNNTYITAPDFSSACDDSTNCFYTPGYSIAYYVEEYKTKLIEMGAPNTITGRLITTSEFEMAPSSIKNNGQEYWFSDATRLNGHLGGTPVDPPYYYEWCLGVRPVIEIPTSELQ